MPGTCTSKTGERVFPEAVTDHSRWGHLGERLSMKGLKAPGSHDTPSCCTLCSSIMSEGDQLIPRSERKASREEAALVRCPKLSGAVIYMENEKPR